MGYFIIETHVLNTTGSFRSEREVEDLWDALISRLSKVVEDILRTENDPDTYLKVKEALLGFVMTLEVRADSLRNVPLPDHLFSRTRTRPRAFTLSFCACLRST